MINKEFSNKLMICPADQIPETIEAPYTGFDHLHANIDINPVVQEKQSRAGSLFEFKLRTVQPKSDQAILSKYQNRRPLVVLLFDTDGNHYQVGNAQIPVRMTVDPVRFVYELNLFANLLESPF